MKNKKTKTKTKTNIYGRWAVLIKNWLKLYENSSEEVVQMTSLSKVDEWY